MTLHAAHAIFLHAIHLAPHVVHFPRGIWHMAAPQYWGRT